MKQLILNNNKNIKSIMLAPGIVAIVQARRGSSRQIKWLKKSTINQ